MGRAEALRRINIEIKRLETYNLDEEHSIVKGDASTNLENTVYDIDQCAYDLNLLKRVKGILQYLEGRRWGIRKSSELDHFTIEVVNTNYRFPNQDKQTVLSYMPTSLRIEASKDDIFKEK